MTSPPLRPLRAEDAEQVAALFVATFGEARRLDAEEIRSWLRNEEFEPGWLQVLEENGRIAGYGDIWAKSEVLELDVVAPGRWGEFFDWAEQEARERRLPFVRTQVPYGHELAAYVEARGYEQWRHSLRMEIALNEPPTYELPARIELRPYRDEDEPTLRDALNEAFGDDPFWDEVTPGNFRAFWHEARGYDPELFALAWAGTELAGFSLAYPQRGPDAELGWIGTLGVRPPWRRRGLGEALLRRSFADLRERGLRRAGLGVDAQNVTGALRLYERVGMRQVSRSDTWRRRL